jgi:hypothetical protein
MGSLLPRDVLVAFLVTRLALFAAGLVAPLFIVRTSLNRDIGPAALAMWTHWDGQLYIAIAQNGYFLRERSPVTAFFPLYPFLMQVFTLWSTDPAVLAVAGVLISNLSLLVMLVYLVALGRLDFDDGVGRRAAVYYLVAPTTLFLSAVYAEPLLMALMVASFYHARRGQFALAGVLAFLCGLARPYGALLAIPLAWEAIRRGRFPFAAVAALLGPLTYFGWLWLQFGDPLLWFKAQGAWPWLRRIDFPWTGFLNYLHGAYGWFDPEALARIDLVAAIALVVMTGLALWRLPRVYGLFAATTTLVLLMATHFQSMTRWTLTVFPLVFLLALWGRDRRVNYAIIGLSFAVALYLMARFTQWLWVA